MPDQNANDPRSASEAETGGHSNQTTHEKGVPSTDSTASEYGFDPESFGEAPDGPNPFDRPSATPRAGASPFEFDRAAGDPAASPADDAAARARNLTAWLSAAPHDTGSPEFDAWLHDGCGLGLHLMFIRPGSKEPVDVRTTAQKNEDHAAYCRLMAAQGVYVDPASRVLAGVYAATADEDRITAHVERYRATFPGQPVNIAVRLGASGLAVADCDQAHEVDNLFGALDLSEGSEPTVRSPGAQDTEGVWVHKDGGHVWFVLPEGAPAPDRAESKLSGGAAGTLYALDRYVLLPPSVRAQGVYTHTGPVQVYDGAIAELVAEAAARTPKASANTGAVDGDLNAAINAWAVTVSWAELLEPHGWAESGRVGDCGCPVFTAPGPHDSRKSATAHDGGCARYWPSEESEPDNRMLHVWTDNPPDELVGMRDITKLEFVTAMEHGGRKGDAMDALGIERPAQDLGFAALDEGLKAGEASDDPGWIDKIRDLFDGDPTPLTATIAGLPPFPVDALPPVYAEMVDAVATMHQVSTAMTGPIALAVLAAACGGCVEAGIRPGWKEVAALHVLVTANPSDRKSPALREMMRPLVDAQQHLVSEVMPRRIEAEALRDVAKQAANKAKNEAAKVKADPGSLPTEVETAQDHAVRLAEELTEMRVPVIPRLLADDITPASLAVVMSENRGRIAVMSTEGGMFQTLMGKYTQGAADVDLWLKGYSGDAHRDDRVSRGSAVIDRAVLTAMLMTQPSLLADITSNPELRGRGVLARAMCALPTSMVGHRNHNAAPVPADVAASYHVETMALAQVLHAADGDPVVVEFSPEARAVMVAYLGEVEPRLIDPEDLGGPMGFWGGKLVGTVGRIALHLHMGEHGPEGVHKQIEARHAHAAIRIGEFFAAHTRAAFGRFVRAGDIEALEAVWDTLREMHAKNPHYPILRREVTRAGGVRPRYRPLDTLTPILETLANHHLVVLQEFKPEHGGRAQIRIWVNPDAID